MKINPFISQSIINTQAIYNSNYLPLLTKAISVNDSISINKCLHQIMLDKSIVEKGFVINEFQCLVQSGIKNGFLTDPSRLGPSAFFYDNGKLPPKDLDIRFANPNQPISSTLEVVGAGLTEFHVPRHKVKISSTKFTADKTHYSNNCEQGCGDYECEVTLETGEVYYYRTDFKITSMLQIQDRLDDSIKGKSVTCNVYYVGGYGEKEKVYSFKETQQISLIINDRCNLAYQSNDPIAVKVAKQDLSITPSLYDAQGRLNNKDLLQLIGAPKVFGESHYITFWGSLTDR